MWTQGLRCICPFSWLCSVWTWALCSGDPLLSCGGSSTFPQVPQPPFELEKGHESLRLRLLTSDAPALDFEWELDTLVHWGHRELSVLSVAVTPKTTFLGQQWKQVTATSVSAAAAISSSCQFRGIISGLFLTSSPLIPFPRSPWERIKILQSIKVNKCLFCLDQLDTVSVAVKRDLEY